MQSIRLISAFFLVGTLAQVSLASPNDLQGILKDIEVQRSKLDSSLKEILKTPSRAPAAAESMSAANAALVIDWMVKLHSVQSDLLKVARTCTLFASTADSLDPNEIILGRNRNDHAVRADAAMRTVKSLVQSASRISDVVEGHDAKRLAPLSTAVQELSAAIRRDRPNSDDYWDAIKLKFGELHDLLVLEGSRVCEEEDKLLSQHKELLKNAP